MKGQRGLLRLGDHLIGVACRRIPAKTREDRYREWTAELPAILDDPDIRFAFRRSVRMLRYSAGIAWRFSLPSRQQTRRLAGAGYVLITFGLFGWSVWTAVLNPHSWESDLAVTLGVTNCLLLTIGWRVRRRWQRRAR